MALNFNISDVNHLANTQLPADTLNREINNVLKFYKATITAVAPLYNGAVEKNITDSTSQTDLNNIIQNIFEKFYTAQSLVGEKGISISAGKIGHANIISGGTVGSQITNYDAYNTTIYIPYLTVDNYGHITAKSNSIVNFPKPYLYPTDDWSGNIEIGKWDIVESNITNVTINSSFSSYCIYEIVIGGYSDSISYSNVTIDQSVQFSIVVTGTGLTSTNKNKPLSQLFGNSSRILFYTATNKLYIGTDISKTIYLKKIIKYEIKA